MEKKELLTSLKNSLNEIMDVTPYDLISFDNKEEEKKYIERKTKKFDLYKTLLDSNDSDGIIVISEDNFYAITPIFIHSDAYRKFFKFLENKEFPLVYGSQDIINYYNDKGYVLLRVVNNNGVIGCDPYIPEKINDYQICSLERINRELNRVHREVEDFDTMNDSNIKYAMSLIRQSVSENEKKLKK